MMKFSYSKSSSVKMPLGKLLVVEDFITNQQLYEALKEQKKRSTSKIGDTLVELDYITENQLKNAIKEQSEYDGPAENKPRLGQILVDCKYITQQELKEAIRKQQKFTTMRIGDTLVDMGFITAVQLQMALGLQNESKEDESLKTVQRDTVPKAVKPTSSGKQTIKVDKNFGALLRLLIKKKLITKEEFLGELNNK